MFYIVQRCPAIHGFNEVDLRGTRYTGDIDGASQLPQTILQGNRSPRHPHESASPCGTGPRTLQRLRLLCRRRNTVLWSNAQSVELETRRGSCSCWGGEFEFLRHPLARDRKNDQGGLAAGSGERPVTRPPAVRGEEILGKLVSFRHSPFTQSFLSLCWRWAPEGGRRVSGRRS